MGPLCCRSWHKAKVFHWTDTGKEWIPAGKLILSTFTDVLISLSLHMNVFLIDLIWVCWLKTVVWRPESGGQTPHWDPKGMEEEGMKQTDFIEKKKKGNLHTVWGCCRGSIAYASRAVKWKELVWNVRLRKLIRRSWLALAAGLADAGWPVPPQHLHRLGEDASVRLQRAEQPGRRLPRNPNR